MFQTLLCCSDHNIQPLSKCTILPHQERMGGLHRILSRAITLHFTRGWSIYNLAHRWEGKLNSQGNKSGSCAALNVEPLNAVGAADTVWGERRLRSMPRSLWRLQKTHLPLLSNDWRLGDRLQLHSTWLISRKGIFKLFFLFFFTHFEHCYCVGMYE